MIEGLGLITGVFRHEAATVLGALLLMLIHYGTGIAARSEVGQMLVRELR